MDCDLSEDYLRICVSTIILELALLYNEMRHNAIAEMQISSRLAMHCLLCIVRLGLQCGLHTVLLGMHCAMYIVVIAMFALYVY